MMKLPAKILAFTVRIYQIVLSPVFPNSCRFYPSCSEYTRQALMIHGVFKGSALGLWRVLRCNPWGKGGYDPIIPDGKPD